jgi:hypothetical protein
LWTACGKSKLGDGEQGVEFMGELPQLVFWTMVVLFVVGVVQSVIGLASWSKGGPKDVYGGLVFVVITSFILLRDVVPDNMRPIWLASTSVALGLLLAWRLRQKRNRRTQSRPS